VEGSPVSPLLHQLSEVPPGLLPVSEGLLCRVLDCGPMLSGHFPGVFLPSRYSCRLGRILFAEMPLLQGCRLGDGEAEGNERSLSSISSSVMLIRFICLLACAHACAVWSLAICKAVQYVTIKRRHNMTCRGKRLTSARCALRPTRRRRGRGRGRGGGEGFNGGGRGAIVAIKTAQACAH
jgi:hypothetical protein